ncbi:Caffeic acid 3-O-methyltransferase 1 [Acorus calamus]|uniref:Caffeic acid 3-O-methyltransferase 1 n=1 Tax=Acorus calamus TaxID=4465 RepID=A0AAV9DZT0_ACOCL|nr:Caffeic acid 3-O-methyltransferase 1 [Acorus calamus]
MSLTEKLRRTTEEEVDEAAFHYSFKLASSPILPMTLKAVLELDLLEIIAAAGPGAQLSPAEVASKLPTTNPEAPAMLDRISRLLASHSVLTCSVVDGEDGKPKRLYGLTPVAKLLTKNEHGMSTAPLALLNFDRVFLDSCRDPRFSKLFNDSMVNHSTIFNEEDLGHLQGL